jgi:hypothetical protein
MCDRCKLVCSFAFAVFVAVIPSAGQSEQSAARAQSNVARLTGPEMFAHLPFQPLGAAGLPAPLSLIAPASPQPASLFDAVTNQLTSLTTTIEVKAFANSIETGGPEPHLAGGQDILTSAGTFGDISRYLTLFPGVVSSSDLSNQMLVRGGHPVENLFLVDGIEVPNINHLANANSTGGLGPMIDAAAIQGLKMYTGGFDANFPERLSSVTEFHTLDTGFTPKHTELDLGIQGVGGLAERRLFGGDMLVSAHHGLVNLVSSSVGMDGVPSYSNALSRFRRRAASGDALTLLNVFGVDSISVTPCASDTVETSTINSTYHGWRETTGGEWQHLYSAHAFGVLNISDSEQVEHIHQEDQAINPLTAAAARFACPIPSNLTHTTPVYREDSNNAFSAAKYSFEFGRSRMSLFAGSSLWLQRPHLQVAQPEGSFSPYEDTMMRADSTSFTSRLAVGESGTYGQMLFHPTRGLSLGAGGRVQTFAFGDHTTITPRLNAGYRVGERAGLHVAYGGYAQLPPFAYMLAYPVNRSLAPMRVTHQVVGMDVGFGPLSLLRVEAYNKNYSAIPAATEYPAVTMHTMVDMLGEQSVWLPMTSGGRGAASGIELSDRARIGSRLQLQGSVAYSRARFAGIDGVLHPSNFDFPWIVNGAGVVRLGHGMIASSRYGYASGRPYTPFNLTASQAQNRPIYDLARLNVPRAPYYSRLDAQLNKEARLRNMVVELYCGVDNVLNRYNFLSYAWMPLDHAAAVSERVGTLWQTPIFPNFGLRVVMR